MHQILLDLSQHRRMQLNDRRQLHGPVNFSMHQTLPFGSKFVLSFAWLYFSSAEPHHRPGNPHNVHPHRKRSGRPPLQHTAAGRCRSTPGAARR
jgi:hypothetical protein